MMTPMRYVFLVLAILVRIASRALYILLTQGTDKFALHCQLL